MDDASSAIQSHAAGKRRAGPGQWPTPERPNAPPDLQTLLSQIVVENDVAKPIQKSKKGGARKRAGRKWNFSFRVVGGSIKLYSINMTISDSDFVEDPVNTNSGLRSKGRAISLLKEGIEEAKIAEGVASGTADYQMKVRAAMAAETGRDFHMLMSKGASSHSLCVETDDPTTNGIARSWIDSYGANTKKARHLNT